MAPVRDLTPGSDGVDRGAEDIRERRPEGAAWRADALATSRHRRLADEIPQPKDDFDSGRAEALCAAICRQLLADYAPGLLLLPRRERRRVQALAAYARTLFDFARQRGLEGERLAQINRWEFTLESALGGQPVGQPIFVAMAQCETECPWPRAALDELATAARRAVTRNDRHPWGASDDRRVARALPRALFGQDPLLARAEGALVAALALRRESEVTRLIASSSTLDVSTRPPLLGEPERAGPGGASANREQPSLATTSSRGDLAPDDSPVSSPQKALVGGDGDSRGGPRSTASHARARFLRFVELTTAALARRARGRARSESELRLGLATRLQLLARARLYRTP